MKNCIEIGNKICSNKIKKHKYNFIIYLINTTMVYSAICIVIGVGIYQLIESKSEAQTNIWLGLVSALVGVLIPTPSVTSITIADNDANKEIE